MTKFEDFFDGSETEWMDTLPAYQRNTINTLAAQGKSYEEIATAWLSANGPANTFPFGTEKGHTIFFEKLVDEIEKFLCGVEDHYSEDRKKLLTSGETTKTFFISIISQAIGSVLHTSIPFIAPVVALTLITVTKIGRNAWCSMRQEQKISINDKKDSSDEKGL